MKKVKLTMRLFFILTVLSSASGIEVSISKDKYSVARGDDVSITCSFQPASPLGDGQLVIITWAADADNPEDPKVTVSTYYSVPLTMDVSPSYEGRAAMTVDLAKRESTLRLSKVTLQDSREFQCRVQIPMDDGGKPAAITSLLVLVAPSVPVVGLQGTAEYWNNITLTCVSEEGSPRPTYAWQSLTVNNVPRPFPPTTKEKDGALSLFNISMETSGFYICTATNQIRSVSYNYTLTVMPPSMNVGSTAGIIAGVLCGVLVLGLLVYCCCRKKKKDKQGQEEAAEAVALNDKPPLDEFGREGYRDDRPPDERVEPGVERRDRYEEGAETDDPDLRPRSADGGDRGADDGRNAPDDRRHRHGGSRDRLDDDDRRYGGSRDRLDDDQRAGYSESRGSRDRLDDGRRYGGSRDRLDDDRRDGYGESRAHSGGGGSRDRLDDGRRYGGSRDGLGDRSYYDDEADH